MFPKNNRKIDGVVRSVRGGQCQCGFFSETSNAFPVVCELGPITHDIHKCGTGPQVHICMYVVHTKWEYRIHEIHTVYMSYVMYYILHTYMKLHMNVVSSSILYMMYTYRYM